MMRKFVLTVSKGSTYLVPDFTDGSYSEAAYVLAKNCPNVQIEVEYEGSKDMDPGIVLQQKGLTPENVLIQTVRKPLLLS